jgi:hypothetical protein
MARLSAESSERPVRPTPANRINPTERSSMTTMKQKTVTETAVNYHG